MAAVLVCYTESYSVLLNTELTLAFVIGRPLESSRTSTVDVMISAIQPLFASAFQEITTKEYEIKEY